MFNMQNPDCIRIRHIIDACNSIERFVKNRSNKDLDDNEMLSFALVRAIEIIGEAASKVTHETRIQIPNLPWGEIVGMRNRLIHAYFDINHSILWATVQKDIPELKKLLESFDCQ